ncbi:nicotinate phosphoribosyltransferase [Ureaplasma ceti]|uniref:nicotinate phosphoribosyltransferase n=1 Tax=Ureaplasma ceti TaxID=3119530 RepID=A0ABP9UCG9_9BACT
MSHVDFLKDVKFSFDPLLKEYYYTTDYFIKSKQVIDKYRPNQTVTMQFIHFSNQPIMVCGIEEVKQLLEFALTTEQLERLEVKAVEDGTILNDSTYPIMTITGDYRDFCHLENIIDGILARRSSVATNCMMALAKLDAEQKIIYMADRSNDYITQAGDGYAAYVAGITLFVTPAQTHYIKGLPGVTVVGTMPHSLIQQYKGDLEAVINDYYEVFQSKPAALIDYHNDVIGELQNISHVLDKIGAVRIDTSKYLIDKTLLQNKVKEHGINPFLVKIVRQWLDTHGYPNVEIVVSSGVTPSKIEYLNQQNAKINVFGIGAYFLNPSVSVTADLVQLNFEDEAKVGRHLLDDRKLFTKII